MGKTVLKWRTRDDWRIGEHESWLRDMALGGLFLKKVGLLFYWFEKSEPRQMRYRIVPVRDIPMTLQQKKAGAPNGWDFVTSCRVFNIYSSSDEVNAPEFPVIPAEFARNLSRVNDRIIIGFVYLFIFGLSFVQNTEVIFNSRTPYLKLLSEFPAAYVAELAVLAYALYLSLSAFISIHRLKKSLITGNPIDHEAPWQKKRRAAIAGTGTAFVILVSVFVFSMTQVPVDNAPEKALPAGENSLPIVRLADIEKNPGLVRNVGDIVSGVDYNNKIQQGSNLLAPVQVKSNESGIIKTEKSENGSGAYTPSISNTVYKLALPFMADKVLAEMIAVDKSITEDIVKDTEYKETGSPYFDKLVVLKTGSLFEMFAVKGNVVIHIEYSGNAGSDTIIKAAAEKISLVSQ